MSTTLTHTPSWLTVDIDTYFDAAQALHWYCADYHAGQWSPLYGIMCALDYRPGVCESGPEPCSSAMLFYESLEDGTLTPSDLLLDIEAVYDSARD